MLNIFSAFVSGTSFAFGFQAALSGRYGWAFIDGILFVINLAFAIFNLRTEKQ